ncbi:hypothetical protein EUGRSUZ_C02593 [Eucalyptus grandis]|uniref:Uncharacterized protein n=2 Tax=Eucalyptus grandis TaxID=71139 RepID=A0ACC3LGC1_EUCGR|nr:hypothetical protein EUGRSUZ_C02593 [Eucalyptus grandis]
MEMGIVPFEPTGQASASSGQGSFGAQETGVGFKETNKSLDPERARILWVLRKRLLNKTTWEPQGTNSDLSLMVLEHQENSLGPGWLDTY